MDPVLEPFMKDGRITQIPRQRAKRRGSTELTAGEGAAAKLEDFVPD